MPFYLENECSSILRMSALYLEKSECVETSQQTQYLSLLPFPVRTFPQWNYRTLNLHAMKTDDYETNEPLESTVLEVLKQMLQLGVHISKQVRDLSGMGGSWHMLSG